jgi:hypothetical protein
MNTDQKASGFDEWAVVELFGHQKIAGRVTEATLAGGAFLRVDVPDKAGAIQFTRYFGASAIYSLSPTSQQIAVAVAAKLAVQPVHRFELLQLAQTEETYPFEFQ